VFDRCDTNDDYGEAEYHHSEVEYRNDTTPGVKKIRAKLNTATAKSNTATIPRQA